ncbi:cellulose biosynthesis cyclic di-GMP-binding regulatory protein BcsB [Brucella sp. IR073]|uniref:cellulose biosynthesis cyclic di-GMP-binding regulatory protein BcsB n=1 Tax=unclassified Brucella TaxID=2632610 RepID=UPI003B983BAD
MASLSYRRRVMLLAACSAFILQGNPAHAGAIGDTIKALAANTMVHERVSLRDLGLTQPVVLGSSDARREIYLPVPANVALSKPSLVIDGHYLRADGGRTTYALSLDGNVVAAQSPTDPQGKANINIGVDGSPRPSGFVRLGLAWSSSTGRYLCDDERAIGNVLQISPDSHLDYSYDASEVKDLTAAWSALPRKVVLLVAADSLESGSYDAAWRLGVALTRAGKTVDVITLPRKGSEIDTSGLEVPPALANIPAFAALARGGKVTLTSEAEVGALLLLDAPQLQAQVAVAGPALAAELKGALDAVSAQLSEADPAAVEALQALTARKDTLLQPVEANSVEVRTLAGRPVITVSPDAAAAATGLFDGLWRRTAVAQRLIVNTVGEPDAATHSVPLFSLDSAAGNLDVVARGDWTTTFDLGTGLPEGKVPSSMSIDVAAAPGATATSPVASVFLNDHLLGAKRLNADGKPENISVDVPSYVLLPRNTVRVQFQRQAASDNCREVPQAYPTAVLPESRIELKDAPAARNFTGMVARLAGDAVVMVPAAWRSHASTTLPTLIQVANAAGISPSRAELAFHGANTTVTPQKPFLALDVPVAGAADTIKVSGDHVSIADRKGKTFYDVSGLDHVAVLQAVTDGKQPGISYQTVGKDPRFEEPIKLPQGNIAVVGNTGVLATLDKNGAPVYLNADGSPRKSAEPFGWRSLLEPSFWDENFSWVVTAFLAAALLLLVLLAQRAKKRRNRNGDHA